jgi:transcriptional regulator GlxA family with amidase domain
MLTNVAVLVCDGVAAFELGVVCEVFGLDRSPQGLPSYDFAVCAGHPGPIRCKSGFTLVPEYGLDRAEQADLIVIPPYDDVYLLDPPPAMLEAIRAGVARGARVLSVCSGAFVLAAAGVLDGRRATTHWMHAEELAKRFPQLDVDPGVLYVEDGPIITSAGTAAGIDACLHLVRTEHGAAVANAIARRMVVPPHRDGGQAQFVEAPVPAQRGTNDELADVLDWAINQLGEDLSVDAMAKRALMSPRTFARRFKAVTGTTPHSWLVQQRVLHAQRLLEEGGLSVEEVARRCGFASASGLREHFRRVRGTSPRAYQQLFQTR